MQLTRSRVFTLVALLSFIIIVAILIALTFSFRSEAAQVRWHLFGIPIPLTLLAEVKDAQLAYEIGNSYFIEAKFGQYDLEMAGQYYQHAIQLNPKLSNVWLMLGRIDFLRGNFNSALYKFSKIAPDEENINLKNYTGFYYWRGLVNGYVERFEESESDFLNVIKGNEIDNGIGAWAAYVDLAWAYFQRGKFEEIKEIMEEAIEFYPQNPWVLTMYGTALLNLGSYEEAETALERAVTEVEKLTPEDWAKAYPGNNPLHAQSGLNELLETIRYNYALAVGKNNN